MFKFYLQMNHSFSSLLLKGQERDRRKGKDKGTGSRDRPKGQERATYSVDGAILLSTDQQW